MALNFRLLTADDIDCRVAQINEEGLSLLLYKDARCDMNILDETVGQLNWKRAHSRDNANCTVSIYDSDKKEWVSKEDTGTESNTEAEKGLASDSFKRSCFNWGIGRELYTAPFIWISADKYESYTRNGKPACKDTFKVTDIQYNERREITSLTIINARSKAVVFGDKAKAKAAPVTPQNNEFRPFIVCADCGTKIYDAVTSKGEPMDLFDYDAASKKYYGKTLCRKCMKKSKGDK